MEILSGIIKENREEVAKLVNKAPDWQLTCRRFDALFNSMRNPADKIWSESNFSTFSEIYFSQREKDKGMSNIVLRTVRAIPEPLKYTSKVIFLQMAEACSLFNASHKVNFENEELPEGYEGVKMIPAKTRGLFTFAVPTPSIYQKISLTFDYWVPKIIEWTREVRTKKLDAWKGENIMEHESCTDFMRICLLFLSDPQHNPPFAKAEDRQTMMKLLGQEFVWVKKSAKREDIIGNNRNLASALAKLNIHTGQDIPLEAWGRIQQAPFFKSFFK